MRFVPFLLMLGLLVSSTADSPPAGGDERGATPSPGVIRWQVGKPLVFSQGSRHLSLGDSLAQVESQLGPWPNPNDSLATFPDKLVVRLDDGHIVMLTMAGQPCPWVLKVDDQMACQIGDHKGSLEKRLGPPRLRFAKGTGSTLWIYYAGLGDAALLFVNDELESVLLAEPGRLEAVLPTAGYTKLP